MPTTLWIAPLIFIILPLPFFQPAVFSLLCIQSTKVATFLESKVQPNDEVLLILGSNISGDHDCLPETQV